MDWEPTRRSLHGVAELLLAGPQHRATGRIDLSVVDGGFATAAEPDGEPTVEVTVTVADQKALGDLREAPVDVALTAGSRADVLTVPVAALVALAEGGYGVEVVDGGGSRFVAVDAGLFAGGRVEVSGAGLAEGMTVGMPS